MKILQNKNYFQIEALLVNGYFRQAIRALLPKLHLDPENHLWYLLALVAASEDCQPDLLYGLTSRCRCFPDCHHLTVLSRALTPGIRVEKAPTESLTEAPTLNPGHPCGEGSSIIKPGN